MFGKFKGQPRGVYVMFATEFWERFSYYGFMGIMVLFMVADPIAGGLGYDRSRALFLFGLFTASYIHETEAETAMGSRKGKIRQ